MPLLPRNGFPWVVKSFSGRHLLFLASWHPLTLPPGIVPWFGLGETRLPLKVCAEWGGLSPQPPAPGWACDSGITEGKSLFSWPQRWAGGIGLQPAMVMGAGRHQRTQPGIWE